MFNTSESPVTLRIHPAGDRTGMVGASFRVVRWIWLKETDHWESKPWWEKRLAVTDINPEGEVQCRGTLERVLNQKPSHFKQSSGDHGCGWIECAVKPPHRTGLSPPKPTHRAHILEGDETLQVGFPINVSWRRHLCEIHSRMTGLCRSFRGRNFGHANRL
jgi:hypothetical protein